MTKHAESSAEPTLRSIPVNQQVVLGARTGCLTGIDSDGRLFVDFPGNPHGPLKAKIALGETEVAGLTESAAGTQVLLVFDNNDIHQPIIVGRIRERVPTDGVEIHVRGRRFTVNTDDEIELQCGEAKLRITSDGKLITLGDKVVSRARCVNRIKGGTVKIN
jgi:hypothetical protein